MLHKHKTFKLKKKKVYLKASLHCFSPRGKCSNSIPTRGATDKHTPTFKQCLKLYEGVLSQPSPCSSRRLQSSRALSYRNRCLCIGLKRASSFMRVGPLLWLIHTLKDPCIRTRPSSQMSPCNQASKSLVRLFIILNLSDSSCS